MRKRNLLLGLTLVILGGAGAIWWLRPTTTQVAWRTDTLSKQDVSAVVTATGTLEAVTTVEVGTQVSGMISDLLVDFNDPVKKGQIIARLDTSILASNVAKARAQLAVAQAQAAAAKSAFDRTSRLAGQGTATPEEVEAAQTAAKVAQADADAARINLSQASANLGYATITSPVDGVVVSRAVDVGQTVNAGMSAPTLFTIAGDLTKMRILVSVDEADIGKVHKDQTARFTVPAFGERRFEGTVQKVRLQSATVESVVTYTVEVSVDNADGALLPGMTATVELVTAEASGVLCAPNAALRLSPEPAQRVASARESAEGAGHVTGAGPSASSGGPGGGGGSGGWGGRGKGRGGPKRLWTIADGGLLAPVEVTVGLQGSTCTEVSGDGITEGMLIVLGQQPTGASGGSSSPFQSQQQQGGWRGPRPGGF